ncbi:protein PHLOEM PROTEIN 2-LIKE A9-like [Solanum pennellii]|uniref:Protein PHLOEM PROTEIN 2-LIKE A9-like n=1 Tax=Solanum pennellii TaxID=28526 RepID=A0ABM1FZP1_SOLPN|nr:protein PHLOEM PROTEIN 2-LIKE A9-like [Solanum pennellii]
MEDSHYVGNHISEELEKGTKFIIYPSAFNIVWGKDGRYWKLPKEEKDPATLVQVSWLEVTGLCDKVEKDTKYEVKFKVKLTPDSFGFNELPLYFMVKYGSKQSWKKIYLTKDANVESNGSYVGPNNLTITTTDSRSEDSNLCFGLYEVWSGKWKGGLIIEEVIIQKMNQ